MIKDGKSRLFVQLVIVLTSALFLSCSSNIQEENTIILPEGEYPMTFMSQVHNQALSRATSQNNWEGNELVAVKIGDVIKGYNAGSDGKLTSETPFYWGDSNTSVDITAWYPYKEGTEPTNFAVLANQNENGGFQQSDFVRAHHNFSFSDQQALTFTHLPAKVQLNLINGQDVGEDDVKNAIVTFENVSLTSGNVVLSDGTVEAAVEENQTGTIIPQMLGTALGGSLRSVQALLVPQQMQGRQFVKVEIGEEVHYYIPTEEEEANLKAGYLYVYKVRVNKLSIEVTLEVSSPQWTSDNQDTQSVTSKIITYDENDIKPGDFFYRTSDRGWAVSDGGLRKVRFYTETNDGITVTRCEQIWEDKSPNPNLGTYIGVIFQNEPSRMSEYEKSQGWTHGYVLAVDDAYDSDLFWGEQVDQNSEKKEEFPYYPNLSKLNTLYLHIEGYRETHYIWDTYRETLGHAESGKTIAKSPTAYPLFYYASIFGKDGTSNYSAPETTSGWYIPTLGQWWDILENLGGLEELIEERKTSSTSKEYKDKEVQDKVLNSLNLRLKTHSFAEERSYWASSESAAKNTARDAHRIMFGSSSNSYVSITTGYKKSGTKTYARCILAF